MKIRIGFVSNSSSSSFIVTYDPNFRWIFESINAGEYDENSFDPDMEEYITNAIQWDDSDRLENLEKYKNIAEEKKWEICMLDISYHNEMLKFVLTSMEEKGYAKVLESNK